MMNLLSNPYLMAIAKVLLILYASQIAPAAPSYITDLFKNTFVKIALIALIVFMTQHDIQFALIFSIILVLGMNVLSKRKVFESYTNVNTEYADYSKDYKPYGNAKLLEPKNEIHPGCVNVTYANLLQVFDNDHYKLQQSAQYAFQQLLNDKTFTDSEAKDRLLKSARMIGLPYNVEMNDDNAPFIATLLLNYGFTINETCKPPGY